MKIDQKLTVSLLITAWMLVAGISGVFAEQAELQVSCDNSYILYLNGKEVGRGTDWMQAQVFSLSVEPGKNVIALEGKDEGGLAGLLAELKLPDAVITTDASWRCSSAVFVGWNSRTYDDANWNFAREYGAYGTSPWYKRVRSMPENTSARWIWSQDAYNDNRVYFRKSFIVSRPLPPMVQATANPTVGQVPLDVRFGALASDEDGSIASYFWNFSDGNSSSLAEPVHTYSNPGDYTVTLTVTDNTGLSGTSSVDIIAKNSSQIPRWVRFQGILYNTEEIPLSGKFAFTFRLYENDVTQSALWEETQADVKVVNGLLDVKLGAQAMLGLPFDRLYWLGVEVNSDGEMQPRFELTPVPYALMSAR